MNASSYKEACQVAKEADTLLTAYDFHPDSLVVILHEEGMQLTYKNAFLKDWKDYIFVFTEHHGTLVYHKTDLISYGYYMRQDVEKLKFTFHKDTCQFCKKEFNVEDLDYTYRDFDLLVVCNACIIAESDL